MSFHTPYSLEIHFYSIQQTCIHMYGIQNICIIYMYTGNTTNIFENEYPQDLGKLSIKIN